MLLLGFGIITTLVVMLLAIWRGILAGSLKTSVIRRKPLLIPSLVFTITIIIGMTSLPIPMSMYHGINQLQYDDFRNQIFRVYGAGAYETGVQVRVVMNVEENDWLEVYAYFSQEGTVTDSLFINVTQDTIDIYGGVTLSLALAPGLYDVSVNATLFLDRVEQEEVYPNILFNQPTASSFLPEIIIWSSTQFILTIVCFFFILGGICIGREDRTRRSEEDIDQEPPREGEVYGKRLGW